MKTIFENFSAEQEIKKSKFLSFLVPFCEFENFHNFLKEKHPKAVHIVWAYRHYNKFFQIIENQSDDGEPKGSSGPPCLDALRGAELINVAVFVVRYFGGIKLGVGGLVRAYSSSTNLVIKSSNLINFIQKDEFLFFIPYNLIQRFDYFFEKENIEIIDKNFDENGCKIKSLVSQDEFQILFNHIKEFENYGVLILGFPLFAKNLI